MSTESAINEHRTIYGQTTLTWEDQARSMVRPILRTMIVFSVMVIAVILAVWMATASDEEWLSLRHDPLYTLALVAGDAWPFFLAGVGLVLAGLIGSGVWAFHRLNDANRRIDYQATREGLLTRDASNFALTVPWSAVIGVRNGERVMRIRLTTGGWRMVFWRAFAPVDREQIMHWAQSRGGTAGTPDGSGMAGAADNRVEPARPA